MPKGGDRAGPFERYTEQIAAITFDESCNRDRVEFSKKLERIFIRMC